MYNSLLLAESTEKELEIVRDLSRTYPSHVYYQQRQGPGQRSLFNVLKAYSVFDRQVSPLFPPLPLFSRVVRSYVAITLQHPNLTVHTQTPKFEGLHLVGTVWFV